MDNEEKMTEIDKRKKKMVFVGDNIFQHLYYKYWIYKRKWPHFLQTYLKIPFRGYLTTNSVGFFESKSFKHQTDAKYYIIEKGYDELFKLFDQDFLRIDDIIDATSGQRIVHYAVIFDDQYLLEYLIENNAHLMVRDFNGYTPLLKAASLGRTEIIRMLIEAGVPAEHLDFSGKTPIDKAKLFKQDDAVTLLKEIKNKNFEKEKYWKEHSLNEKYKSRIWLMKLV